jgi:uncharacterized membrane protein
MTSLFNSQLVESCSRHSAAIIILAVAFFLFWLVTIIDIVSSEFRNNADKIIWFFFVLMLAPIGMLLYLFIGRHQKNTDSERESRYRDVGRD